MVEVVVTEVIIIIILTLRTDNVYDAVIMIVIAIVHQVCLTNVKQH